MKTSIKNILKTDPEKLTPSQKIVFKDFVDLEEEAKPVAIQFAEDLKNNNKVEGKAFKESINSSNLKKEEKDKANDLFSQMILKKCEELSNRVFQELKKGEGPLYNMMVSETVIDFLDIIQEFKASLEKYLPIPLDEILRMASPFIIASVSIAAPGIGIALKTTGILEKAADFLETKNLNATLERLSDSLADLRKDTTLEVINKTAELSQSTGISAMGLNKLGLTPASLDIASKKIKLSPEVKTFVHEIASYAEKTMPRNQSDIDQKMEAIKKSAIDILNKEGAPKALVEKLTKQIDDNFAKIKEGLKPTLDPKVKIFDKITAHENGAKLILDCARSVSKIAGDAMPGKKNISKNIESAMTKEVNARFKGDLSKVIPKLQNPAVKVFAREALGAGHATLIKLESNAQTLNKSSARGK